VIVIFGLSLACVAIILAGVAWALVLDRRDRVTRR
jgi:hypothetical protein